MVYIRGVEITDRGDDVLLNLQTIVKPQRPRHVKQHDRFLYQRRVSEKISACVGGSLSDEEIALLPLVRIVFQAPRA